MRAIPLTLGSALLAVLVAGACAASTPVKSEPSKEAQLAMLKDEGYYAEEEKDGRFYVFGAKKTHDAFAKSGGIQIARTYIGAGPGRATVVLEAKDKLPEMTDRLAEAFSARHGVSLK